MTGEHGTYTTDSGVELLASINASFTRGLSREKYEEIKDHLVGPDFSAAELIHTWLEIGYIKWKNDKLVTDLSKQRLLLDEKTEDALRERSLFMRMTPQELIMSFIQKGLQEK